VTGGALALALSLALATLGCEGRRLQSCAASLAMIGPGKLTLQCPPPEWEPTNATTR